MRLKSGVNQKKDLIYGVVAIALTILLALYLFWVVRSLANKANDAFSAEPDDQKIPTFDFDRYDKLMQKLSPSSTIQLPPLTKTPTST